MALGVTALGWTAAWLLLARGAEQALDRWIAEERSRDREWACADRRLGGFPFQLTVDCSSPAFRSAAGAIQAASAGRLTASSSILARRQIDFTISGPLKVSGPQSAALLTWANLTGFLLHGPDAPDLSVRAQDVKINEASGPGKDWSGASAQALGVRLRKAPDRAPGSGAQEVTLDLNGVKAAPADALIGNEEPLKASLSALVLNADFGPAGRIEERIERWSASGGRLLIKALSMEKGRSRLEANGDLSLDDRRRPAGQVSVRVEGVQPLLSRLNLPAAPLAIEGLLRGSARNGASNLLENRTLPLEMRNGRLFIGPIRTPLILPPLF